MGDNDKFCGVCGAPNTEVKAAGPTPQAQPQPQGQPFVQPQPFVAPQPAMNVPKGCMAQAFNDMIKVPGALVRVCQIAFAGADLRRVGAGAVYPRYRWHRGGHWLFARLRGKRVRRWLCYRVGSRPVAQGR